MTENSRRNREAGSSPERRPPDRRAPVLGDDLPQILEVFGSAPLVRQAPAAKPTTPGTPPAGARASDALADDPQDWDPLASVDEGDEDAVSSASHPGTPSAARPGHTTASAGDIPGTDARIGQIDDMVRQSDERLGRVELGIQSLSQQSQFLPPKLRGLSKKVDELAIAVGDVRVRSLLVELVGLGDLVDGALKALPEQDSGPIGGARRFFRALATRIDQVLEAHDAHSIPIDGGFDPTVHNAVDVLDVDDPALEGQIVELVRPGFRTEHSVLRYAEVAVGRYRTDDDGDERESRSEDAATRLGVRLTTVLGADDPTSSHRNEPSGTRRKAPPGHDDDKKNQD